MYFDSFLASLELELTTHGTEATHESTGRSPPSRFPATMRRLAEGIFQEDPGHLDGLDCICEIFCIAAIGLAAKRVECSTRIPHLGHFNENFSLRELARAEAALLAAMRWEIGTSTACDFIHFWWPHLPADLPGTKLQSLVHIALARCLEEPLAAAIPPSILGPAVLIWAHGAIKGVDESSRGDNLQARRVLEEDWALHIGTMAGKRTARQIAILKESIATLMCANRAPQRVTPLSIPARHSTPDQPEEKGRARQASPDHAQDVWQAISDSGLKPNTEYSSNAEVSSQDGLVGKNHPPPYCEPVRLDSAPNPKPLARLQKHGLLRAVSKRLAETNHPGSLSKRARTAHISP